MHIYIDPCCASSVSKIPQGREAEMFKKLAAKYKVASPLDELNRGSKGNSPASSGMLPIPSISQNTLAPASPFPASSNSMNAASPFGGNPSTAAASPFGQPPAPGPVAASSPFGKPMTSNSPFGSTGMATTTASPFASTSPSMASPSPFGSSVPPAPASQPPPSNQTFNGRSARDLLMSFYQQKNPSKVAEVDKLLAKYRGNEEQMFRNLAKKYQLDPSVFGISSAPATGVFGSPQAGSSFGLQSNLGSGQATFGQSAGFGQPAASPGFGGQAAPSPGFGGSTGHTFGSTGSSPHGSSFGSLAQSSPSPFGAPAPSFGAPSGFGNPAGAFGGASPFGAPRR
jgi:hypothetical protein